MNTGDGAASQNLYKPSLPSAFTYFGEFMGNSASSREAVRVRRSFAVCPAISRGAAIAVVAALLSYMSISHTLSSAGIGND